MDRQLPANITLACSENCGKKSRRKEGESPQRVYFFNMITPVFTPAEFRRMLFLNVGLIWFPEFDENSPALRWSVPL
jgi:hypothetical protein